MKIKQSTIDIILLCTTFYEILLIPHLAYIFAKYVVLLYLFYRYFPECGKIKLMTFCILIYGMVTFFSTAYNGLAINTIIASFFYCFQIVDVFIVTSRFVKKNDVETLVKIVFKTFLAYIVLTDVLFLIIQYDFSNPAEEYLIGNKFVVSYLHCFESCLLFYISLKRVENVKKNRGFSKKVGPFLFTFFSFVICYVMTCTTGMVICIVLGVLMLIPDKFKLLLSNSKSIILVAVVFNVLILGSYGLFRNPLVAGFISNVLGKSTTWIGRLRIYDVVMDIILRSPVVGYGYFNNVVADEVSFGNAQNGILKILADSGILGLIGYFGIIYFGLKNNGEHDDRQLWPLYVFIYAMVAASLVEINLTHMIVFFTISVIFAYRNSIKERGKKV